MVDLETPERIELEIASLWMRQDGIMVVHISDIRPIELADAMEIVKAEGVLSKGRKVPILHLFDKDTLPGKEVREYSASPESSTYCSAEAFVANTLAQKILGNFYVRINKPSVPSKMFLTEEEAIEWLTFFL